MNWYKIAINEEIILTDELTGSHSGQLDMRITARDEGGVVGRLDYVIFGDEMTVSWVVVEPEYRQRGIATMMYDLMKKNNPEETYKPSWKTELGAKFEQGYNNV